MESPPSCSTWSEAFILSDDSGLLLTSGSISSGSMSGDSRSGQCHLALELLNSDYEDKSLSQTDSLDDMSDVMCGENFNTLKKGPNWSDTSPKHTLPIEPPPEFQDKPTFILLDNEFLFVKEIIPIWLDDYVSKIINRATIDAMELMHSNVNLYKLPYQSKVHVMTRPYWTSEWLPYSPCHGGMARPNSRNSLGSSRLSCSHNSLSIPSTFKPDDSSFITQAVSHDTLTSNQISDLYNVPFDSDIYAVPVDMIKPSAKPKRNEIRKKRRNTSISESGNCNMQLRRLTSKSKTSHIVKLSDQSGKRHSVPGSSIRHIEEPIHMTVQEVRQYLQTLYSSSSDSSEHKDKQDKRKLYTYRINNNNSKENVSPVCKGNCVNNGINNTKNKKNTLSVSMKNRKKDSYDTNKCRVSNNNIEYDKGRKCPVRNFSSNLKQAICNLFRFRRFASPENKHKKRLQDRGSYDGGLFSDDKKGSLASRALPPLPAEGTSSPVEATMDFASSIEKVKDYGWYWGPISSEAAEKILSNEPDGSFIVRDSSDHHYIFSLTFKLNNCVRHVRIEHDQGNFSFGSRTKFKSHTIIEFIENAVEHSRSGRYLFFLHRRPILGPMRVQLLHPVSRFKQTQSLQHMCRFVILKLVRKDLIPSLPLPCRIIEYLNTPHYYSEQFLESDESESNQQNSPTPVIEDTR